MADLSALPQEQAEKSNKVFQKLFDLPKSEKLDDYYTCAYHKKILLQGRLYLSRNFLCFYSNVFGYETKVVIPMADILHVEKKNTALVIPNAIQVDALKTQYFFASFISRDQAFDNIQAAVNEYQESLAKLPPSVTQGSLEKKDHLSAPVSKAPSSLPETGEGDGDAGSTQEGVEAANEASPHQHKNDGEETPDNDTDTENRDEGSPKSTNTSIDDVAGDMRSAPNESKEVTTSVAGRDSKDSKDGNAIVDHKAPANREDKKGAQEKGGGKEKEENPGRNEETAKKDETKEKKQQSSTDQPEEKETPTANAKTKNSLYADMHIHTDSNSVSRADKKATKASASSETVDDADSNATATETTASTTSSETATKPILVTNNSSIRTPSIDRAKSKKGKGGDYTGIGTKSSTPEQQRAAGRSGGGMRSKTPPDSRKQGGASSAARRRGSLDAHQASKSAGISRTMSRLLAGDGAAKRSSGLPRSRSDFPAKSSSSSCPEAGTFRPVDGPLFKDPRPPVLTGRRAASIGFTRAGTARYPFSSRAFWDLYLSDTCTAPQAQYHRGGGDEKYRYTKWKEQKKDVWTRDIYFVKTKLSGPLGPKQTRVHKIQRCELFKGGLLIDSNSMMPDVPFGGYFHVAIRWVILDTKTDKSQVPSKFLKLCPTKEKIPPGLLIPSPNGGGNGPSCVAQIWTSVEFTKFTLIKYQIRGFANTGVRAFVADWIKFSKNSIKSLPGSVLDALQANKGESNIANIGEEVAEDASAAAIAQKMMGPSRSVDTALDNTVDDGPVGEDRGVLRYLLHIVGDKGPLKLEEGVSLILVTMIIILIFFLCQRLYGSVYGNEEVNSLQRQIDELQKRINELSQQQK
mmetsp:Transcript_5812/g.9002  ORF Transcript_5812/g.9002 Transcript_5812/m.9002 type:complete len:860 (-) Transcript_5812:132-2711(-)